MKIPAIPQNETERLNDLALYRILDTPREAKFDDLAKLAASVCGTPFSLITFVDSERQWFKASVGLNLPETERRFSFCAHAILGNEICLVPDTLEDERFIDNPFVVKEPGIRFYAGIPLISFRGNSIGTLCVLDTAPKEINPQQQFALRVISDQVVKQLELSRSNRQLQRVSIMQDRLLTLLVKDFKSPICSAGTLLNVLQDDKGDRNALQTIIKKAAAEFGSNLDILDNLVEWARVYQGLPGSSQPDEDFVKFITAIFGFLEKQVFYRNYRFCQTLENSPIRIAGSNGLTFVIRNIIHWLCESARDGSIVVQSFSEQDSRIVINIRLVSMSISDQMVDRIDKFNGNGVWPENTNAPIEGLRLFLAMDILKEMDGSKMAYFDGENTVGVELIAKDIHHLK
ncbi:GAF domain-containing protein [Flavitalea flava]